MYLSDIPLGTVIHNIELKPGKGGSIARGAGTYAQLNARDGKYAIVKMPSGETRMILVTCIATIGSVSNSEHNLAVSGKAGRSRWLGRRPRVRGEGRNSGGHPRSRNGIPAKGFKTRSKSKYSDKLIIERRKK
jgi:large subunit ribosomal protein L2